MPLTKARRAELEAELLKTLDRLDALKLEELEARREHREQLSLNQKKVLEIRGILSGREVVTKTYRARGPVTVWVADQGATRVPAFVIEQTGLKKKAQIVAKYGENARFEAGRPSPRPTEKAKDDLPRATKEDLKDELCLDCGVAAGKPSKGCTSCDHPEARPTFSGITWIATDGSRTEFTGEAGGMPFRLTHREDDRWELETRSGRERVFRTVGVLGSRAEAEERVRLVVEGREPLDGLVGSRAEAVRRHKTAGKAAAG